MRLFLSLFILTFSSLAATVVCAQDGQSGAAAPGGTAVSTGLTTTGVKPDDVVISIQGFCDASLLIEGSVATGAQPGDSAAASGDKTADCRTDVTRAQFEKLVDSIDQKMRRSDRIRVAVRYSEALVFAKQAKALGIDKDPQFQEAAKYAYLQGLSATFNRRLTLEGLNVTDAELETYYRAHPEIFVQGHFVRIFVPNERKHATVPSTPEGVYKMRADDAAAMKSLAVRIRARAVAGGNFAQLQAEVYKFAGKEDDTPDVDLDEVNRTEAPAELQQVFDLKPGQISELITAPKGWHIVKMVSRKMIPLPEAKGILQRIRILDSTNAAKSTAKTNFNDAYFNTPGGMEAPTAEPNKQK